VIATTTSRKHVAQIAEGGFHIQLGAVHIHIGNRSTISWTSNTLTVDTFDKSFNHISDCLVVASVVVSQSRKEHGKNKKEISRTGELTLWNIVDFNQSIKYNLSRTMCSLANRFVTYLVQTKLYYSEIHNKCK